MDGLNELIMKEIQVECQLIYMELGLLTMICTFNFSKLVYPRSYGNPNGVGDKCFHENGPYF